MNLFQRLTGAMSCKVEIAIKLKVLNSEVYLQLCIHVKDFPVIFLNSILFFPKKKFLGPRYRTSNQKCNNLLSECLKSNKLCHIAPVNLWNKFIDLRILSKRLEGPYLWPLRSKDVRSYKI